MKRSPIFLVIAVLLLLFPACKTYDTTLTFTDIEKPMQFGNFESTGFLDTLGFTTGYELIEFEEDTFSENENISISMSGGEYYTSNIDSMLIGALFDYPSHFLGNSFIQLEIRHGIKAGAFIFGNMAAGITGSESTIGDFTNKKFTQTSIVFNSIENDSNNEN